MRNTGRFRGRIIEFCQAPLPAAGRMLLDHPELLSDLAEQQLSLLCDVASKSADWRSQVAFRGKWAPADAHATPQQSSRTRTTVATAT
jgi:hypothetical protein